MAHAPLVVRQTKSMFDHRKVLALLVSRDLRVRYSQSILGYLWTVIDPLASALIYFMLFVVIFRRADAGHAPYFLFLLAGLLPWQWYNASVSESMRAIQSEVRLVKSTKLPREIWVVRIVASKWLEFVYSLPVLVLFTAFYMWRGEAHLNWHLIYMPVAMVLQFILLVGIGLVIAPLTVLINDITSIVRIYLRIYFYMTPIIFNLAALARTPEALKTLFWINPLTGILELYRAGFFHTSIRWHVVGVGALESVAVLVIGGWIFHKLEGPMLKEL